MDLITQRLTSEADIIQTNAMNARLPEGKYGNASHRDWIARNDPDGTELKAYDEMMAKRHRRKARKIKTGEDSINKDNADGENINTSENSIGKDNIGVEKNNVSENPVDKDTIVSENLTTVAASN